ncbi:MAG: periplasmic heavy metal sensor [Acidobacteriota bacterium]|nr:periplasmic heavy metal sensor [Acidobacteriota bacterium]
MRNAFLVLSLCLTATLPLAAQNTTNLPWWTSPVVSDLGLSQEQTQKIREIVRSYRNRLFDARNNAGKAEAELQDLLNDPTVNVAAAKPAIERLAQSRAETTRVFTQMSVEVRSVLTLNQWREVVKRWAEVQKTRKNRDTEVAP